MCVGCHIEEVVSLIYRCFFYLQRIELSRPPMFILDAINCVTALIYIYIYIYINCIKFGII